MRALLDVGEECVVVRRSDRPLPEQLAGTSVVVEQGDAEDLDALRAIADRHGIDGILHLAPSAPWPLSSGTDVADSRKAVDGLLNVAQIAQDRSVRRLGIASTIAVYDGVQSGRPLPEDTPLSLVTNADPIATFKKVAELLTGYLADTTGLDVRHYRISAIWGPLGHLPDRFFAAPALVGAAARGTEPDLSSLATPPRAGDGLDLMYVKDTARALALLQTAEHLPHRVYNVGAGTATTNAEVSAAIRRVVPDARVDLPEGGETEHIVLDIARLQEDTGYRAEYNVDRAVEDYLAWLRAGHDS